MTPIYLEMELLAIIIYLTNMAKVPGKLKDVRVSVWGGLNTAVKNPDDLPQGTSQDSLNWITGTAEVGGKYFGDHIELRRGTSFIQAEEIVGTSPVSGLGVGIRQDGTQIPFFSTARKLYYYDVISNTNIEISNDVLPNLADGEDVSIIPYQSITGYYVLVSSPNSSFYKISVANPNSILDFNNFDLRGKIAQSLGRSFLWGRKGKTQKDLINLYVSYADAANYSQNPPISAKNGIVGPATDGVTQAFNGILVFDNKNQNCFGVQIVAPIATPVAISAITKAETPQVTAVAHLLSAGDVITFKGVGGMVEINNLIGYVQNVVDADHFTISINTTTFSAYTAGGTVAKCEQFTDDQNGNLISDGGGTGTINYITGVYSVTFNTPPVNAQNLIISFYQDDSSQSIAKFLLTGPTNATDGDFIQQQGFGQMMNVFPLSGLYFCMHEFGTYQLQIVDNDVKQASQIVYRNSVGIPYWRAGYATGDGIVYMDTLNASSPTLRVLEMQLSASGTNPAIVPRSISDQLDLKSNAHDQDVVFEWGDYYILECKGLTNGIADPNNDIMYLYNQKTGTYDRLDYRGTCFANYYGALLSGDSISPNLLVLFSGFDDLGYNINNYWKSAPNLLGAEGVKRFNRFVVKGLIDTSQNLGIYFSLDGGQYTKYATVEGNGQFVNLGIPYSVGGPVMGSNIVGGGGVVNAYGYEAEFRIASDMFSRISVMFKAEPQLDENDQPIIGSGVGYISVDEYEFKDIRLKSGKIMATNLQ